MILPRDNRRYFCGKCGKRTAKRIGTNAMGGKIIMCKCGWRHEDRPEKINTFVSYSKNDVQAQSGVHATGDNTQKRETGSKELLQDMLQGTDKMREGLEDIEGDTDKK